MTTTYSSGKPQSIISKYIGEPVLSASEAYSYAVNQVGLSRRWAGYSGVDMTVSFRTLLKCMSKKEFQSAADYF